LLSETGRVRATRRRRLEGSLPLPSNISRGPS
jgi:hypothetical protein